MAMYAHEFQRGLAEDPASHVGGRAGRDRQTETLVRGAGGNRVARWVVAFRNYPDKNLLPPLSQRRKLPELTRRVNDDASDAKFERGRKLVRRLAAAVQQDARGGEAGRPGDDKLSFRADIQRKVLLGDPAGHRATPERPGAVGHLVRGHGLGVLAAAHPYMLLVKDERRGPETLSDLGEAHAADRQRRLGGEWPAVHHASRGTRCSTRIVEVIPPAPRSCVTAVSRSAMLRQVSRTSKSQSPASRHASATPDSARRRASKQSGSTPAIMRTRTSASSVSA